MQPGILIVCAVAQELAAYEGRPGVDVIAVGVGPVEAAVGTTRALARVPYRFAINAGIGGGFRRRTAIGDAVAITEGYFVDLGLEGGGTLNLPGGITLANHIAGDGDLLEWYGSAIPHGRRGIGLTSATITTTDRRAADLDARFSPSIEAMEGFAVLRAAKLAGVPAIELRGVSNYVGDRAASEWDFRAGAAAVVAALATLLDVVEQHA
ncbi:MAG: futalosine hydrolase [Candidatus Velthaea sp.]